MKNSCWLFLAFTLVGCSHQSGKNELHFPYAGELLSNIQKDVVNRAPASLALEAKEEKSTRRVYFSTLYHQYLTFSAHLERRNDLAFCPQFHHDKLEVEAYSVPRISLHRKDHVDPEGRDFFPELALQEGFSLKKYHSTLKEELELLCEEGISDNFFKFDNLVTHYAFKKSFHLKTGAMESVLKIPIFANFYLIKMIENPTMVTFSHPEEKAFIDLSRTHWFDQYVTEASKRRSRFLRNKMVQRSL